MHKLHSISMELLMKLKEIVEQLKSYKPHHQVIAMTEDGEKISTAFELYTCLIHSNIFSIFGNISHIGEENYHFHVINNKNVILILTDIPYASTRRGYRGQEIDYVEPEDKELLFVNNLESIYCGTYKYLQPYNIFLNIKEQIIIQCKGK